MSAIPSDAADISTSLPHPTGAATVININSVTNNFETSNPASPTDSASASSSSTSAPASFPDPRHFSIDRHQAEYRVHAFLANESTVATLLAGNNYLQKLFAGTVDPDKDIIRAASAASRARLQNPFAYNTSRSTRPKSEKENKADELEAKLAHDRSTVFKNPDPDAANQPNPIWPCDNDHSLAPPRADATEADMVWLNDMNKQREYHHPTKVAARTAAAATKAALATAAASAATASTTGSASPTTAPSANQTNTTNTTNTTHTTPADPSDQPSDIIAKIGPNPNPTPTTAPTSTEIPAQTTSDLAIWQFDHLTISPPPATLARFEEHAIFIAAQWEANRQRDLYFDRICKTHWPRGP